MGIGAMRTEESGTFDEGRMIEEMGQRACGFALSGVGRSSRLGFFVHSRWG
jgi:hypothetical protein